MKIAIKISVGLFCVPVLMHRLLSMFDPIGYGVEAFGLSPDGPEDLAYENGMETMKLFVAAGIKYKYSERPGGHTWMVCRQDLRDIAPLLFK